MLCQNCGKYEATTHVKRIINGEAAEAPAEETEAAPETEE